MRHNFLTGFEPTIFMSSNQGLTTALRRLINFDIGYRTKVYSDIQYIVGLCALQSDIGRSDIRLSPISLITDIGLSAYLWQEIRGGKTGLTSFFKWEKWGRRNGTCLGTPDPDKNICKDPESGSSQDLNTDPDPCLKKNQSLEHFSIKKQNR